MLRCCCALRSARWGSTLPLSRSLVTGTGSPGPGRVPGVSLPKHVHLCACRVLPDRTGPRWGLCLVFQIASCKRALLLLYGGGCIVITALVS